MASAPLTLVSFLATVALLSAAAAARPCNTIFISYYSFSLPNPNPNHDSPRFLTVFTQLEAVKPSRFFLHRRPEFFLDGDRHPQVRRPEFPSQSSSTRSFSMAGSLRDRTKDIVSVVVALLFGVGCGFLTAATMYLAWSLFSTRFYDFHGGSYNDDGGDDEEDDDVSLKKVGYVKIPDNDFAAAPAPAKAAA